MRVRFSTASLAAATWAPVLLAVGLLGGAVLTGCNRNEQNGTASGVAGTDATITGAGEVTTAGGGQGAGPTGTEGDTPGDNPASQATEEQQKAEQ